MQVAFFVMMFILGACLGSFLCCQARRLRLKEEKQKPLGSRSVCLSCKTKLRWYDNIPIISWIFLRGKCRKCGKKIGVLELLSELGMALAFLLLSVNFNVASATMVEWLIFVFTLLLTISLGFLAIYDGAYGELPISILTTSIICAIIILALKEWLWFSSASFSSGFIFKPLLSILILGGLYLVLYLISKGKWVGDGDWLLGLALGLALADPWLALIVLFLANLLACLVMFPNFLRNKDHKIYFGPFLVVAFVVVYSFSDFFQSVL